jgi:hypothetical protein
MRLSWLSESSEKMVKGFVLGVVATIWVVAAVVFVYFATGMAPVASSAAPMPLEWRAGEHSLGRNTHWKYHTDVG